MDDSGTPMEPVIDGDGSGVVVEISADNITLDGFTVQNSGATAADGGILLQDVTGCTIKGNTVINNANGIALILGSENEILDNEVNNNSLFGIALAGSSSNLIKENNLSGNEDISIAIDNADAAGAGLATDGSDENTLEENVINISDADGIFIGQFCDENELLSNIITDAAQTNIGIHVWRNGSQVIVGNTVTDANVGVKIRGMEDGVVTNNVITGNNVGLEIEAFYYENVWYPAINNTITTNDLSNNTTGIKADHAEQTQVFATCNWWGSAEVNVVAANISGDVVFLPFLLSDEENNPSEYPNGFDPIDDNCEAPIPLTIFLQGPYDATSGEMATDLNSAQLPASQPYNSFPWSYAGDETLPANYDDAVDWVLVELRDDNGAAYTVIDRFAGLLNKDGSITAYFTEPLTEFYIVVYHRNHMPVMTANIVDVSTYTFPYDFTVAANLFGSPAAVELETDIYGMIAGDVTHNGQLKYSGPGNDRGPIIAKIIAEGGTNLNGIISNGYWFEDVNMNNELRYLGTGDDRAPIFANLNALTDPTYLNSIYTSLVPGAYTETKDAWINDGPINIGLQNGQIVLMPNEKIYNGLMDNIQFTLAWKSGDDEAALAVESFASDCGLLPQGGVFEVNGESHRVFVSIDYTELPREWESGQPVALMSIDNMPEGRIWIADNQFTSDNNAMYYVSVWGEDLTGEIKQGIAGGESNITLSVYPNPVFDGSLNVIIPSDLIGQARVKIFDMQAGLRYESVQNADNQKVTINVSDLNSGVYLIQLVGENKLYQTRFIITK
jgi:parallel beta-helix repeat protein